MHNTDVEITPEFVVDMMNAVRVKTSGAQKEIEDLIQACLMDLERNGIYITTLEAQVKQAIKLYCKGFYGYDDDADRFKNAYKELRDAMALSSDYGKVIENG